MSNSRGLPANPGQEPRPASLSSPDPLDGVDGTPTVANPYHYADNDPLNKTDPTGLRPTDDRLSCEQYFAVESYIQGAKVPAFDHCGRSRGDVVIASPLTGKSYEEIACGITWDADIVFGDGDWSRSKCERAKQLADISIDRAAAEYPTLPNSGTNVRNAFQHAYWNTLMTIELGERVAEGIATNHEVYNVENTVEEYVMDMRNNYVGRIIGRPLEARFITSFDVLAQNTAAAEVKAAANRQQLCVQSPKPATGPCYW